MSEDEKFPFPKMKREEAIAALAVASVAAWALVIWLLTFLPWFVRGRGTEYVSAFAAVSTAAAALFTFSAAIGAAVYVVLTYRLWKEAAAQRESELMLRLLNGYDKLRDDIRFIQSYYLDCAMNGPTDPLKRFRDAMGYLDNFADNDDQNARRLDDSRFSVSRFFVRTRKLVRAGFLSEAVVIAGLDREAVQDVFLNLVDPLDEVKAGESYKPDDRDFYEALLKRYPSKETS